MIGNVIPNRKVSPLSPCHRHQVPSTSDQGVRVTVSGLPFQEHGVHTHMRTQVPVAPPLFPQRAGTPRKGHSLLPLTAAARPAGASRASPACSRVEAQAPPYRAPCDVQVRLLRCFPTSNCSNCHLDVEVVLHMRELLPSVGSQNTWVEAFVRWWPGRPWSSCPPHTRLCADPVPAGNVSCRCPQPHQRLLKCSGAVRVTVSTPPLFLSFWSRLHPHLLLLQSF